LWVLFVLMAGATAFVGFAVGVFADVTAGATAGTVVLGKYHLPFLAWVLSGAVAKMSLFLIPFKNHSQKPINFTYSVP